MKSKASIRAFVFLFFFQAAPEWGQIRTAVSHWLQFRSSKAHKRWQIGLQEVKAAETGELLYVGASLTEKQTDAVAGPEARIEELREELDQWLRGQSSSYARASWRAPLKPEVKRDPRDGRYRMEWLADFVDEQGVEAWRLRIAPEKQVIGVERVGHHLAEGRAAIYPEGPVLSDLSEVILSGLLGDGSLSSRFLSAISAADVEAYSENNVFNYPPDDPRFDQVQGYFFVDRAVHWFLHTLRFQLSQPLVLKVHAGGVGKSNAAFYFQDQIFIGTGDGVLYRHLARDPSVVFHETSHAVIDELAQLPSTGEGGSLNEGFADFFAACMLNNPRMGEASYLQGPYRRTIENNASGRALEPGSLYGNGVWVGATLWDVRKEWGIEFSAMLALRTLSRLGAGARLEDFPKAMAAAAREMLTAEQQRRLGELLERRGWVKPAV